MRIRYFLPLLLLSALVSCRTEVEYNGEVTDPKLVVFAQTALLPDTQLHCCFVQQSTFFLDDEQKWKPLGDATVEWQVNNGNRHPFAFLSDSDAYQPTAALPRVAAGDRVTMHVSHPRYSVTSATQTVPAIQPVQVTGMTVHNDTLSEYYEQTEDSSIHVVQCRQRIELELTLPPYPFHNDDVVRIAAKAEYRPATDSTYHRNAYLSSKEPLFRTLTTDGDWGIIDDITSLFDDEIRYDAFYFPVSFTEREQKAEMTVYTPSSRELPSSLLLTVHTMTHDTWLYYVSIRQQSALTGSILGLGQEEQVQVYGNFEEDVIGVYIVTTAQTNAIALFDQQP